MSNLVNEACTDAADYAQEYFDISFRPLERHHWIVLVQPFPAQYVWLRRDFCLLEALIWQQLEKIERLPLLLSVAQEIQPVMCRFHLVQVL